ncbi:uncharacterized protein LOC134189200 [Corticium candelabrum]|uniref:uncharacterized protein LOC134189200 n=1 Tax=Corticium candelabrum TaxID=121492 RepID=UPI002E253BC5|nr:uncharacterized protein LOC134189200 [Corticium candelabrum]
MKVSLALLAVLVSQMMLSCIAVPVISQDLIVDPNIGGSFPVGISLLYAKWENTMLVNMPVTSRSYAGVANFNYAGASADGNKLTIPFTTSHPKEPVCTFTQEEGDLMLSKIKSDIDEVVIHLFDVGGAAKNWKGLSVLNFNVVCIGTAPSTQTSR